MYLEFRQGKPQGTFLPKETLAFIGDSETRIFRIAYAFDESDIFQFTELMGYSEELRMLLELSATGNPQVHLLRHDSPSIAQQTLVQGRAGPRGVFLLSGECTGHHSSWCYDASMR